jgi:hypothetical protein
MTSLSVNPNFHINWVLKYPNEDWNFDIRLAKEYTYKVIKLIRLMELSSLIEIY